MGVTWSWALLEIQRQQGLPGRIQCSDQAPTAGNAKMASMLLACSPVAGCFGGHDQGEAGASQEMRTAPTESLECLK